MAITMEPQKLECELHDSLLITVFHVRNTTVASQAPSKSPAHTALRKLLSQAGLSADTLRDLLWLINAHDQLVSFPQICQNLNSMLTALSQQWNTPLAEWGLEEWPTILQWISEHREALASVIGGVFDLRPKHAGHNTVIGRGSVRYPLYATLLNRHQNPEQEQNYRLLQAHLLVAQILTLRKFSTRANYEQHKGKEVWKGSPNSIYSAALAVRQLSEERSSSLWMLFESYPVALPPTQFAHQLLRLSPPSTKQATATDSHSEIARFLGKAASLLEWRRRFVSDSGASGTGGKPWQNGYVDLGEKVQEWPFAGDPDDPDDGCGNPWEIRRVRHRKSKQKQLLDADDSPWEDPGKRELYLVGETSDQGEEPGAAAAERAQRKPGERIGTARAQVAHLAMANQLLPWAPNVLTVDELTEILEQSLHYLQQLSTDPALWSREEIDRVETIALLQVMLATGSVLERAAGLRVLSPERSGEQSDVALLRPPLGDQPSTFPRWRLRALRVRYASEQHVPDVRERALQNDIFFPDWTGGSYFVGRFLAARSARRTKIEEEESKRNRVFHGSPRALTRYRKRLRTLLRELDPTGRLTESKVASWLFLRVMTVTGGDVALASILTAQPHPLAHVRSFYATPSLSLLANKYCEAVSQPVGMVRRLISCPLPVEFRVPLFTDRLPPDMRYVGSRRCPSREAVAQANLALRKKIRMLPAKTAEGETWIEYHNCYTLYAIAYFNYATGMRGIITPYLRLSEVDCDTGYAKVLDKGDRYGYKTRLLWIPPQTITHMGYYENHLATVRDKIKCRKPSEVLEQPCFFLRPDSTPVNVKPSTIRPLIKQFLPFPANVHRRFIRSELQASQCSPEVIDSWMGHWYRGEEPWGEYSSFSYRGYRQSLGQHLLPLLKDLGFGPLKSRLR